MSKSSKSYWQKMSVNNERDRGIVKSWFAPMCDDLTAESAEILCDMDTDREKKLRAVMVDSEGKKHVATRTLGGKTFVVTISAMGA